MYTDPTTGEYVGEYEYREGDGTIRRLTGWFASEYDAKRFARTGH